MRSVNNIPSSGNISAKEDLAISSKNIPRFSDVNLDEKSDILEQSTRSSVLLQSSEDLRGTYKPPSHDVKGLITYLVYQYCLGLAGSDLEDKNQLFKIFCSRLMRNGILENVDFLDDFQHYQDNNWKVYKQWHKHCLKEAGLQKVVDNSSKQDLRKSKSLVDLPTTSFLPCQTLAVSIVGESRKSRYEEEFAEMNRLGTGGYGSVYQAQNKLDGVSYAVKKIKLKSMDVSEKVLREVRCLAKLDHCNVVRYHASWVEYNNVSDDLFNSIHHLKNHYKQQQQQHVNYPQSNSRLGITPSSSVDRQPRITYAPNATVATSQSLEFLPMMNVNNFAFDIPSTVSKRDSADSYSTYDHSATNNASYNNTYDYSANNASYTYDESSSILTPSDLSIQESVRNHLNAGASGSGRITLFIKMQLCDSTLQQWMEREDRKIDEQESMLIFRQLVSGLEHVHAQGLIHRDLKPANIFINRGTGQNDFKILIGDFGLAKEIYSIQCTSTSGGSTIGSLSSSLSETQSSPPPQPAISRGPSAIGSVGSACASPIPLHNKASLNVSTSQSPPSVMSMHTGRIGTKIYCAPEQEVRSKGEYTTKADIYSLGIILFELFYVFDTRMERVKVLEELRKGKVPEAFEKEFPREAALILAMLASDPDQRPTATEILEDIELYEENTKVLQLKKQLEQLQATIHAQERTICALQRQLHTQQGNAPPQTFFDCGRGLSPNAVLSSSSSDDSSSGSSGPESVASLDCVLEDERLLNAAV